jgi:hypothetical protein
MTPLCKYDTAVTLDLIFQRFWLLLKGISIEKTYTGKLSYTISKAFTQKIWGLTSDSVIDTTVTKIGDFVVNFLREFESIFKKALTNPCIRGLNWYTPL